MNIGYLLSDLFVAMFFLAGIALLGLGVYLLVQTWSLFSVACIAFGLCVSGLAVMTYRNQ